MVEKNCKEELTTPVILISLFIFAVLINACFISQLNQNIEAVKKESVVNINKTGARESELESEIGSLSEKLRKHKHTHWWGKLKRLIGGPND